MTKPLENLQKLKVMTEDGHEIVDIIQITQYLDGWIVLTKKGELYANVDIKKAK